MELLVVRHGIALDREEAENSGIREEDRPLTDKGRSRLKDSVKGLEKQISGVASIVVSPLRRAVETAAILRLVYDGAVVLETRALRPDAAPEELSHFLMDNVPESPIAVVGHEPHLGIFMGWCLTGESRSFFELKKGGACLIRFEDAPGPAKGTLVWQLPPSLLRRLR